MPLPAPTSPASPASPGSPASPVHAVTDVTGFGLAGHGWEIAERSGVTVRFHLARAPLYPGAWGAADAGARTGGDARNRAYLAGRLEIEVSDTLAALAVDPQTSGGLLAAVGPDEARTLGAAGWWDVGEVLDGSPAVELV